jgi:tetratricopeptide (TPR) repeat protein
MREHLPEALHFRAVALGRLDRGDEQLAVLAEVFGMAEAAGNHYSLFLALGDTSAVDAERGRFEEARPYCERALRVAEQMGAPEWIAWNTRLHGQLAWYMGDWEQARTDLKRTIALKAETGESLAVAFGLASFGWQFLHEGAWTGARIC